jgi:Protein of unknown function (DUF3080)
MRLWRKALRTAHPGRQLLCCTVLALLPACQPSGPEINPTTAPSPPRSDELLLNIPADGLDRLDFLALSGCAVQATIIKRNSSLGRLAKPSQRLLLELEYLRLAPPCITHLRDSNNDALADLLEEAWQLRRKQLPALIFNATLGSDEYQAFWLAVPAPGQYPRVSHTIAAAALDTINNHTRRWLGGDYQATNRDFEVLLSEVAGGGGGALLQVHTDRTDRSYQQLLPSIADLETQLNSALPQPYHRWIDDRTQRFVELASASCHHLKQLERVQQPCADE